MNADKPFPWRRVFRFLAESYYWSPDVVKGLTIYQVFLYTLDSKKVSDRRFVTSEEAKAQHAKRRSAGPTSRKK